MNNYAQNGGVLVISGQSIAQIENCSLLFNFGVQNGVFVAKNGALLTFRESTLRGNRAINCKSYASYHLDALGTVSYSEAEFNSCEISESITISNDAFVNDMFHCALFCHFEDDFILETHKQLNDTKLTNSQSELFNLVSTLRFTNKTLIHQQKYSYTWNNYIYRVLAISLAGTSSFHEIIIRDLNLTSSEPFIGGLLSTINVGESKIEDIVSSDGSHFLSGEHDSFINITLSNFTNA